LYISRADLILISLTTWTIACAEAQPLEVVNDLPDDTPIIPSYDVVMTVVPDENREFNADVVIETPVPNANTAKLQVGMNA
jgi:hypothetical protein